MKPQEIWDWFNNKKTVIGTCLLLAAQAMRILFPDGEDWAGLLENIAAVLGVTIASLGLAHKYAKRSAEGS
jgi:hypothetical protein